MHSFPIAIKIKMIPEIVPVLLGDCGRLQQSQSALRVGTQFCIRQRPRRGRLYAQMKAQPPGIHRRGIVVFVFVGCRGKTQAKPILRAAATTQNSDVKVFFRRAGRTAPGKALGLLFQFQLSQKDPLDPTLHVPTLADKGVALFPTIEIAANNNLFKRTVVIRIYIAPV